MTEKLGWEYGVVKVRGMPVRGIIVTKDKLLEFLEDEAEEQPNK